MQKPSLLAMAIGLVPFIGMCLSVPWWDRVLPLIFGLPFNLFWLILWIILSSGCMALANRVEERRRKKGETTI